MNEKLRSISVFDANETAFWKRELEHIKSKTYDIEYPELSARKLFPVSTEGGEGVVAITYEVWDQTGIAKIVANYARDIPRVDVHGQSVTVPVRRLADAFGMTIDEIKAASRTGRPLSARKAQAARYGHEVALNNIAFNGDSAAGLVGIFSHPNIPNGNATTGAWTTSTTSADEIVADVTEGFAAIRDATNGVETPNAMAIPRSYYDHIAMARLGDNADTTVLDYLLQKCPYLNGPDSIIPCNECESVASLAGEALSPDPVNIYYRKDPMKLELEIPEDINFLEPQKNGLEEETIVTMTTGGLNVYKPLSIYLQIMTPAA